MITIKEKTGVRIYYYLLSYLKSGHKEFIICKGFQPGSYAIKATNKQRTSETVIAVCKTRKLAKEIILNELKGNILADA